MARSEEIEEIVNVDDNGTDEEEEDNNGSSSVTKLRGISGTPKSSIIWNFFEYNEYKWIKVNVSLNSISGFGTIYLK